MINTPEVCDGCNSGRGSTNPDLIYVHRALVIAGSISNAQRRTMKFEASKTFGYRAEAPSDLIINVGSKALLSFIYDEDRPALALDTWLGRYDNARYAEQMTTHQYTFNALALDTTTDREIQRRGNEKLYGLPTYIIRQGSIDYREYDPDGSEVLFDVPRIS